jgi:MFS family permease
MVALVQAMTSLPMFLLSLPAGALADVMDRRRLILFTQAWMLASATALGFLTLAGLTTPGLLLLFTFLLGLGTALNGPAWQAIVPEIVPREDLPGAVTLQSIGFNIARAVGPAIGGLLVAVAGPAATFLLNAASFFGVLIVLVRWRRTPLESVLPGERFFGALRTGLRYVRHAPAVQAVIVRSSTFVLCASALWALLPLVARTELGQGPAGYGLLLAAQGAGAVSGAFVLPRLKRGSSADGLAAAGILVFAAGTAGLGALRSFPLVLVALFAAGGAWLSLLSSFNVALQTVIPSWVRGRALSVYMLGVFGGLTLGSALWGAVADRLGTEKALWIAAGGMVLGLAATWRVHLPSGEGLDLAPSRQWPAPRMASDLELESGPVLVTIEYRIDPERVPEFMAAMQDLRRIRLRDGSLQWGLFMDADVPDRWTEVFLVESWVEHLRQHERVTVADEEVRHRAGSFHAGDRPPEVRHLVAERFPRA